MACPSFLTAYPPCLSVSLRAHPRFFVNFATNINVGPFFLSSFLRCLSASELSLAVLSTPPLLLLFSFYSFALVFCPFSPLLVGSPSIYLFLISPFLTYPTASHIPSCSTPFHVLYLLLQVLIASLARLACLLVSPPRPLIISSTIGVRMRVHMSL